MVSNFQYFFLSGKIILNKIICGSTRYKPYRVVFLCLRQESQNHRPAYSESLLKLSLMNLTQLYSPGKHLENTGRNIKESGLEIKVGGI